MGSMLRSMKDLNGFTIGATDGDMGQVETCYFDDASFTVRHLVVEPLAGESKGPDLAEGPPGYRLGRHDAGAARRQPGRPAQ